MSDLKICEILDAFYPCVDGPVIVVKNYSVHLNRQKACKVAVPKDSKKLNYVDNEEFEVFRCASIGAPEKYRLAFPGMDVEFKKLIEKEKFDIYHTHSPFTMGRFAINAGRKHKVPVVATLHTQYQVDFKRVLKGNRLLTRFMIKYIMWVYNRADSVWTVNNASCQVLRDYGYKGKIEVVRNGTDLKYPENAEELVNKVNALHNLEGQKNVLIFVGRIAMYKNLALMADALKILNDNGEDFKMIIIGDGFDMEEFKVIVQNNGLNDKVIFTGAIRDRELLQGYYLRSDLFLFPSTFDTSSLVPIESAAHKLPTLLIKDSYTAENITDGVNGFLSEETPKAYADKIKEIINNPLKLKEVGEEAYRSVYRSWEMVAEEVLEKYKEIIKEYNAKRKKKCKRNQK